MSSTLGIRSRIRLLLAHLVCFALPASLLPQSKPHLPRATPEYTYKVIHIFPHDATAFTQGLTYKNGFLYEGTGLNGHSSIRKVRLETGEVIEKRDLPSEFFGEGVAVFNKEIVQLTWLSHKGFVYTLNGFAPERTFTYSGEGWGLATDGPVLFMSDGTSTIRVLNPTTFREERHINVSDHGQPVTQLNELEVVEGELFANVWQTDRIARISPRDGHVSGWINLAGLLSPMYRRSSDAVLNGIAYDAQQRRLFVTGKLWPSIFEIRVVKAAKQSTNVSQ